jgi:molybdenum cofactor cytidylyltransferase
MIAAIVLAGGRSRRMGQPKALLLAPCGRTFVARLVDTLTAGGADIPLVVGRPDDESLKAVVESLDSRARWVANPDADLGGQLSSLQSGLRKADRPGVRAVMMVPIDSPMVEPQTVSTLIAAFIATNAPIVRPRYRGRNGHPVVFSRAVFDDLRRADPAVGAKAVLRAHHDGIVNVDVDDAGVIGDVDTPEDYERMMKGS